MSRYIDAEALVIDYYDDYETKDDIYTYAYVSEVQIGSAPSIDLVFCGECKHTYGNPPIADGRSWCKRHGSFMYYCSDGEREGE